MKLCDYIEIGAKKAGSVAELGRYLGLTREATTQAKSHKRPLPADAVMKLADYIGEDLRKVIAANELVTEKKEEKIRYWNLVMQRASGAMAMVLLAVTLIVSPTPPEASNGKASIAEEFVLCKVALKIVAFVKRIVKGFFPNACYAD